MRGAISTTAIPSYNSGEIAKQVKAFAARIIVTQAGYVGKLGDRSREDCDLSSITIDSTLEGCLPISVLIEAD